jgi:SOS-response transcriptional repressor LexA
VAGKATVKVFGRDGRRFCLKPCNEEHDVIYLDKKDDPQIKGVIVGVIHREK